MNTTNHDHHICVLMDVSSSGRSTVVSKVVHQPHAVFLGGDFLRPRCNTRKMASGEPPSGDDRKPWLQVLNNATFAMQCTSKMSLIICFALKKHYRDSLREGNPNLPFIYLKGDFDVIESRLKARGGHFFKTQMLVMQSETPQELGTNKTSALVVDISQPLEGVMVSTIEVIKKGK